MKVRYLGHACFEFTSNDGVKLITDPYTKIGYELPEGLTADILTVSHGHFDHSFTSAVHARSIVSEMGVRFVDGIELQGIPSFHDPKLGALRGENIIYKIKMDGFTLCHMGDIGEECSGDLVEKIGNVDILFIPVGGTYTIDDHGAKRYIDALKPRVVVPMHYKPEDGALDIATADNFLALYSNEKITYLKNGMLEMDNKTTGIVYMERVK